jgi:hypothetical protein
MMKARNLFPMMLAIAVASGFAACSSEITTDAPQQEKGKVSLSVAARQAEITPSTRLAYDDPDDGSMTVTWSSTPANEKLGVVSYDGTNFPAIVDTDVLTGTDYNGEDDTMEFDGTVTTPSSGTMAGKYSFYYPTAPNTALAIEDNTVTLSTASQASARTAPTSGLAMYDLMYTAAAEDPSDGVTLQHACALLRFKLPLPSTGVNSPQRIYLSAWKPVFATSVTLSFNASGNATLSYDEDERVSTINCSLVGYDGPQTAITAYMMTPAVADFTGLLCKVSVVNGGGNVYSYVCNLTANDDKTAADGNLSSGKVYTFAPSEPLQLDRWATSNVYWDGTKLTFNQNIYDISQTAYQGLYFKWGSLTGRSAAAGDWDPGATLAYSVDAPVIDYPNSWSSITYDGATSDDGDLLPAANDICTQINSAWRLPKSTEFSFSGGSAVGTSGAITPDKAEGTYDIPVGALWDNLVYFSYSGSAFSSDGDVLAANIGTNGQYWSSEAKDAGSSYYYHASINTMLNILKTTGYPVRCIKKAAGE